MRRRRRTRSRGRTRRSSRPQRKSTLQNKRVSYGRSRSRSMRSKRSKPTSSLLKNVSPLPGLSPQPIGSRPEVVRSWGESKPRRERGMLDKAKVISSADGMTGLGSVFNGSLPSNLSSGLPSLLNSRSNGKSLIDDLDPQAKRDGKVSASTRKKISASLKKVHATGRTVGGQRAKFRKAKPKPKRR